MKTLVLSRLTAALAAGTLCLSTMGLPATVFARDQEPEEADAGRTGPHVCDNSSLVISVIGDGKPVAQAEVIVMYSPTGDAPEGCSEGKMPPTNAAGQITFSSGGKGKVRIIVIAPDWDTCHDYVNLKKGQQTHQIKLKRTPHPDHE